MPADSLLLCEQFMKWGNPFINFGWLSSGMGPPVWVHHGWDHWVLGLCAFELPCAPSGFPPVPCGSVSRLSCTKYGNCVELAAGVLYTKQNTVFFFSLAAVVTQRNMDTLVCKLKFIAVT